MDDEEKNRTVPLDVQLSKGTILTITNQNTENGTENGAPWACAAVHTDASSSFILATIVKSDCWPPPNLVCYPGVDHTNVPVVAIELWFHGPRPDHFLIEVCCAQSGATRYYGLGKWPPNFRKPERA